MTHSQHEARGANTAVRIAEGATALDLSTSKTFSDFYISAMLFPED